METLYIIGNGFDLQHRLNTWYSSFGLFLREYYPEIYDNFIEYYGFGELDEDDEESLKDPLWSDFENALAGLDFETILDENTDYLPNYSSDEFRSRDYHTFQQQIEQVVDLLTTELNKAFKQFILNVDYPGNDDLLLEIDSNAFFFNFNYTETLEKYYNINPNQILYIHNKAEDGKGNVVLGHGINPDKFKEKPVHEPNGLSEEDLDRWREEMSDQYDYAYDTGKEEMLSYFLKSNKPTHEIIQQNESFFSSLNTLQRIFVFGHSLSDVDLPYFREIVRNINPDVQWTVSYHLPDDRERFKNIIQALGVDERNIVMVRLKELQITA